MMKANYIEFYFDCSSPWTYLAFVEIESLSQRHELEIDWKPVLVGGVFNTVNQDVYEFRKKPNPLKLNYSNEDLHLWSRIRGISISFPEVFPVNSVKAMRGCLFANKESKLAEFANNVFQAYWSEGKDISQEELLLGIAKNSNLNTEEFSPLNFEAEIVSWKSNCSHLESSRIRHPKAEANLYASHTTRERSICPFITDDFLE